MGRITAFDYPPGPHVRRHGPFGYTDYVSYRDWLRDDFCFRCVFCLRRERWVRRRATFHIDHLVPRSEAPERECDYTNLVYVCASCNSVKSDLAVPDPCQVGFGQCVRVHDDGRIEPLSETGEVLIDLLRLDDEDCTRYRKMILDTLRLIVRNKERDAYLQWMGYPEKLPDLIRKAPPGNSRPDGVKQSYFARKLQGKLPDSY